MEYSVVFELTDISKNHYYGAAGVFGGSFIVAFSIFLGTFGTATHERIWKPLLAMLFSVVFLYFSISLTIDTTKMLNHIYGCYESGDVQVVEGIVENCDTEHFYKNGRGSFEVNETEFNYGRTVGIPGYRGKNNLIHTNGQMVKICYISYSNENVIVQVELLE